MAAGCMSGDVGSDKSAIDSTPTSPRLLEAAEDRPWSSGKSVEVGSSYDEEATGFGKIAMFQEEHVAAARVEGGTVDRYAGGDEIGRRMALGLPPSKQILNKLARENAQLKMALNRLMGKGIYSNQERLVSRNVHAYHCACV